VKSYGGGTSLDMIDMAEMSLRRDPDALIIHSGTNDFDQKVNTKNQLQRVIAKARGKKANIEIGISAICHREDRPELQNKIKDMNNQLKNFCHQHQVTYIDHDDFDGTYLATKKLHPNANGNASLFADFNRTIATIFGWPPGGLVQVSPNDGLESTTSCKDTVDLSEITNLCQTKFKHPKLGYLNINTLQNKIVDLRSIIHDLD